MAVSPLLVASAYPNRARTEERRINLLFIFGAYHPV
jgi:hypothetical protein